MISITRRRVYNNLSEIGSFNGWDDEKTMWEQNQKSLQTNRLKEEDYFNEL